MNDRMPRQFQLLSKIATSRKIVPAVALRNALWRENQELCDEFIYCSISFKTSPYPLLAFHLLSPAMSI